MPYRGKWAAVIQTYRDPNKKWIFTLNKISGTLDNFVNSLRSDRTEVVTKVALILFVN
jgi:hypothetical protein